MFENDFKYFVIYADRAYDIPASDPCLTDENVNVIAGFYSASMAFAVARAININMLNLKTLNPCQ